METNKKRSAAATRYWMGLSMDAKIDRVTKLVEGSRRYFASLTPIQRRALADKKLRTRMINAGIAPKTI